MRCQIGGKCCHRKTICPKGKKLLNGSRSGIFKGAQCMSGASSRFIISIFSSSGVLVFFTSSSPFKENDRATQKESKSGRNSNVRRDEYEFYYRTYAFGSYSSFPKGGGRWAGGFQLRIKAMPSLPLTSTPFIKGRIKRNV